MIWLLTLAGGAGAFCRWGIERVVGRLVPQLSWPAAVLGINVVGSFLLGLCLAKLAGIPAHADLLAIIGTGFLGAFTTFSTVFVDTVRLLLRRHPWLAFGYSFGTLAAALVCAWLGLLLG